MHVSFRGYRDPKNGIASVEVLEDGKSVGLLNPRHDLRNHSPDGFEWGYAGSGPAQLALALAAYAVSDRLALDLYQDLKWHLVAKLPPLGWELKLQEVTTCLKFLIGCDGRRETREAVQP